MLVKIIVSRSIATGPAEKIVSPNLGQESLPWSRVVISGHEISTGKKIVKLHLGGVQKDAAGEGRSNV